MLCIISNVYEHRTICALCRRLFQPHVGPELAVIDTQELVCMSCGVEHELELANLVRLGRTAETYALDLAEAAGIAA